MTHFKGTPAAADLFGASGQSAAGKGGRSLGTRATADYFVGRVIAAARRAAAIATGGERGRRVRGDVEDAAQCVLLAVYSDPAFADDLNQGVRTGLADGFTTDEGMPQRHLITAAAAALRHIDQERRETLPGDLYGASAVTADVAAARRMIRPQMGGTDPDADPLPPEVADALTAAGVVAERTLAYAVGDAILTPPPTAEDWHLTDRGKGRTVGAIQDARRRGAALLNVPRAQMTSRVAGFFSHLEANVKPTPAEVAESHLASHLARMESPGFDPAHRAGVRVVAPLTVQPPRSPGRRLVPPPAHGDGTRRVVPVEPTRARRVLAKIDAHLPA